MHTVWSGDKGMVAFMDCQAQLLHLLIPREIREYTVCPEQQLHSMNGTTTHQCIAIRCHHRDILQLNLIPSRHKPPVELHRLSTTRRLRAHELALFAVRKHVQHC